MQYLAEISESIKEAELVVVGLGEEWNISKEAEETETYKRILADIKTHPEYQWLLPYVYEKLADEALKSAYQTLFGMLEGKNYFVVATTTNPAFLPYAKPDRVVMPCGSALKMRDENLTEREQYPEFLASLDAYISGDISIEEIAFVKADITNDGVANSGKTEIVPFNNIFAPDYNEDGYLPAWSIYMRWLQGTMNRKVCLLELGAGLEFPSVFRFPFEKLVYFNQKAICYRVHSFLYQLTEEMVERSVSVPVHAVTLLEDKNATDYK